MISNGKPYPHIRLRQPCRQGNRVRSRVLALPGGDGVEGKALGRPSSVAGLDEMFRKTPASRERLGHQKGFGLS
jgi:hypothetical protein